MADTGSKRWKRLGFGITLAFLGFYVGTVGYAAGKVGDFYHLWLAGYLVASGRVADLYDPAVHHALLQAVGAGGLWTARNDAVGAFFYPPNTELFQQKRDLAADLVYALLVGKPSWLLATVWIPVVRGRWRALAATPLGAAAIVAGALLVLGPGAYAE